MSTIFEEYRRSLKMAGAEEVLDTIFFRPLGYLLVRGIRRFPITPNQVTLASLACGLVAAWDFGHLGPAVLALGGLWYLAANVLDCADGQLARLQHSGTLLGRFVDGAADYLSSIAVFIGIGIGLSRGGMPQWWLVAAAAASTALHAVLFDRRQSEFIAASREDENVGQREIEQITGEIERLRQNKQWGPRLFLLIAYLRYLGLQKWIAARFWSVRDGSNGVPPERLRIRMWSFLGPTTNRSLLIICALMAQLDLYLWGVVVAGNLWLFLCIFLEKGDDRPAEQPVHEAPAPPEATPSADGDRPSPIEFFRQSLKSDSFHADELINIYLLRPIAAGIVWLLYPTRVTPNKVTAAAIACGFAAAVVYGLATPAATAIAGLLVTAKDVLDDADGQLARAKQLYSRRGRFLDSIGDFVVDLALFGSITMVVAHVHPGVLTIVLGCLAFLGTTLRVSYHVFYQVSFLHLENRYRLNRIVEEITPEDRAGDPVALKLQKIFSILYTWQDRLMARIDAWCMHGRIADSERTAWYSDRLGLRLSGLLGFGTEFALLSVCSLFDALDVYLLANVFLMNAVWIINVAYRRYLPAAAAGR